VPTLKKPFVTFIGLRVDKQEVTIWGDERAETRSSDVSVKGLLRVKI
jgi:hypothetical protein